MGFCTKKEFIEELEQKNIFKEKEMALLKKQV